LANAAVLCDVNLKYVSLLAGLDAHEKCLVASGRLKLAQLAEGERLAKRYTEHDATLDKIGPDYVVAWLDRVTAPAPKAALDLAEVV